MESNVVTCAAGGGTGGCTNLSPTAPGVYNLSYWVTVRDLAADSSALLVCPWGRRRREWSRRSRQPVSPGRLRQGASSGWIDEATVSLTPPEPPSTAVWTCRVVRVSVEPPCPHGCSRRKRRRLRTSRHYPRFELWLKLERVQPAGCRYCQQRRVGKFLDDHGRTARERCGQRKLAHADVCHQCRHICGSDLAGSKRRRLTASVGCWANLWDHAGLQRSEVGAEHVGQQARSLSVLRDRRKNWFADRRGHHHRGYNYLRQRNGHRYLSRYSDRRHLAKWQRFSDLCVLWRPEHLWRHRISALVSMCWPA